MQFRIVDILILFFVLLFEFWGYRLSYDSPDPQIVVLDNSKLAWNFISKEGKTISPILVERPIHYAFGPFEPCCSGTYVGEAEIAPLIKTFAGNKNTGLLIHSLSGFSELRVNGSTIPIRPDRSFNNIGPIVAIPYELLVSKPIFHIELDIQGGPGGGFTGLFRGPPALGDITELSHFRDRKVSYFQSLPFIFAIIYFVLAMLFIWLTARIKIRDPVYREFIYCLLASALFYSFLSGVPRVAFPDWTLIVHYPSNVLLFGFIFRLLATFASFPPRRIQIATAIYLASTMVSAVASYFGHIGIVYIFHLLGRVGLAYPLFLLRKNLKSPLHRTVFMIALPVFFCFVSDGLQILSRETTLVYPFKYIDRYTSPFIFLTSLVYLLHQVVDGISSTVRRKAWEELASQVSHDIKSPLAALEMALEEILPLPEDTRVLIRGAVGRVKDISNNLLVGNRLLKNMIFEFDGGALRESAQEPSSLCLISSLIEPLLSEKRFQYRSKLEIEIESRLSTASYGLFAEVQPVEFKRLLSNLVNNAVEALDGEGKIVVDTIESNEMIVISCKDNGHGIPADILNQLGTRGATFNKENGLGLGLFHAKSVSAKWGGDLTLTSEVGLGTTVTLRLPKASVPTWFLPQINLAPGTHVVVLDDDSSVHKIWHGRFEKVGITSRGISIKHLSTPQEIKDWVAKNFPQTPALFLVDYELLGFSETGLDLIESLGIGPQSTLVTSRFEEKPVFDRCVSLDIRLLPKGMAAYVPLVFL